MRFCFAFLILCQITQAQITSVPVIKGEILKDLDGNPINAHGAGMLVYKGVYYLFGEIKKGSTWLVPNQNWEDYRVPAGGISCYSSKDLIHWKNEGIALAPVINDPANDLDTSKVIERPKVVYNTQTKKFVMWMHVDTRDYSYAQAGVAICDNPLGPYTYIRSVRPNGNMARDMSVFQDGNGKAYLIFSSENNLTMHVCLLSDDYLSPTAMDKRILVDRNREAPAMFKAASKYYLITSACTGWSANQASWAEADSPFGPWTDKGNPCSGPDADSTFHAQSSFVLAIPGKPDTFLFMADRWNRWDLPASKYIWLPLHLDQGKVEIPWK